MGHASRGKCGPGTNRSAEDHGEKNKFTDRGGTVGVQQANRTADGGHSDPPSGPIRDVAGHRPSGQDRPEKYQPSQQGPPRGGMRVVGDKDDHHGNREPDPEAEGDTPQPAAKKTGTASPPGGGRGRAGLTPERKAETPPPAPPPPPPPATQPGA